MGTWKTCLRSSESMTEHDAFAAMQAENARWLVALLDSRGIELRTRPSPASPAANPEPLRSTLSAADKVALFRRLFHRRTDVYPVRWESTRVAVKSQACRTCLATIRQSEKPKLLCSMHLAVSIAASVIRPSKSRLIPQEVGHRSDHRVLQLLGWDPDRGGLAALNRDRMDVVPMPTCALLGVRRCQSDPQIVEHQSSEQARVRDVGSADRNLGGVRQAVLYGLPQGIIDDRWIAGSDRAPPCA